MAKQQKYNPPKEVDGERIVDVPAIQNERTLESHALELIVSQERKLRTAMGKAVDKAFEGVDGGFLGAVARHTREVLEKKYEDDLKGAKIQNETVKICASMLGIATSAAAANSAFVNINNNNGLQGAGARVTIQSMSDEELAAIEAGEAAAADEGIIDAELKDV